LLGLQVSRKMLFLKLIFNTQEQMHDLSVCLLFFFSPVFVLIKYLKEEYVGEQ
jgi:hypothetical protein